MSKQATMMDAIFGENQMERQEIDFNAIGAMLCGKDLTPEQEANVAVFNMEYDEARARKEAAKED